MTIITDPGNWNEEWCNFTPDEVKCQHCGELKIDEELMDLIQAARETLGPLRITSGFRCSEHNNNISSTGPTGPHTTGKAIDIATKSSQQRKELIDYFASKVSGLGIAKSFIHIDLLTSEDGFDARPNSWIY
jgi:zinc D-Ala-D-Ala carboxypeptidase|tara:strand:+ start:574 stop:969 length:396 start_codon:yes stop_codon:yes gene_type:complete